MENNYNIVYIEDNRFNIKLIQNLGEKLGLEIKAFENPKEGLEYCLNNDIDLLLIDYMMPELNGIDLVNLLKKEKPDIPIVMMTALDDLKLRQKATLSGIDGFLPKPINMKEFKDVVFKLLNKKGIEMEDNLVQEILDVEDDLILVLENKKIINVNRSFLNFFNYRNVNEVNFDFLKSFAIEDKYAWGGNIDEFIQSILKKTNYVKVKKNGENYFFQVKMVIYKQNSRVIIIFKDITEKEKLREETKNLKNQLASLQRELRDIKEGGFFEKLKLLFGG